MGFRLVSKSVTLKYLERHNGPYFALFQRIRVRCRRKTIRPIRSIPRFPNVLLIVYDHINTACAIIQRVGYLGKTRGGNSIHFRL